jgi:phosphatidylglycerol:prolipoprotein diacylglycerol transferase
MIGIGFIIALAVGMYRAKRMHKNEEAVMDIAMLAGVLGFLGAKLLFVIISFQEFLKSPLTVLGSSGFVVYGGIVTGVIVAILYCRHKKLAFLEYFDLIMPEIAIAQGFGRIGCFMAGCCYGRETDSWIGVTFPAGSFAPSGVKLIPTQLFSSVGDFFIAAILILIAERKKDMAHGNIGAIYMLLYGVGRFVIEIFRNDDRGAVGILSTSQFISIFIVAAGIVFLVVNHRKQNSAA